MPGRIHPNWIEAYLKRVKETEPSSTYHIWVAVQLIASTLGRKCQAQFGPETFFPNFYIILVGPPGARKGTAIRYGISLLNELIGQGMTLAPNAVTRQQFIVELENARQEDWIDGKPLIHHSLLVVADELAVFMGDDDPQRIADLCELYDGKDKFDKKTKTAGSQYIINPAVWILGATTPHWIEACMPQISIGGGLTSRIILAYASGKARAIPLTQLKPFNRQLELELVHDLRMISKMKGNFTTNQAAKDTFDRWYLEYYPLLDPKDKRLVYFMDRLPSMVMKLSMVVSASRRDDMTITGGDVVQSIEMFRDLLPGMTNALGGMGMNPLGKQTEMVRIMVIETGGASKSSIMTALRMHINEYDYQRIKITLMGQRVIRPEHRGGEEWLVPRKEEGNPK